MTSISSKLGSKGRAIRLGASSAGLVSLGALALACSGTGTSDEPDENLGTTQEANHAGEPLCDAPVAPDPGCCDYTLPNNADGGSDNYFNTDDQNFVLNLRPEMPFWAPHDSPFSDSDVDVFVVKGWTGHGAVDYFRTGVVIPEDPSFPVRAVADGRVITVMWDNATAGRGMGNTIVIEHTAPSGERYRSVYGHLRNGATNDCNQSKAFVLSGAPIEPNFRAFMNSQTCPNPALGISGNLDPRVWGSENQVMMVRPGDTVVQGQFLGWAGNTGMGGTGNGLTSSGTFGDPVYVQVHLHMFFTVHAPEVAPAGSGAEWINVDPYGAYASTDSTAPKKNCYLYGANVAGHRLFAPFKPTFAGVRAEHLAHYLDYYPSMGYMPQTLSVFPTGSQQRSAGSFQPGRSPETIAKVNRTKTDFVNDLSQQAAAGLQLREIQVSSLQGNTRYNGIWARKTASIANTVLDLDDTTWGATLQGEANNGRHATDEFTYQISGIRRHAGIFVADTSSLGSWNPTWGRTLSSFNGFVTQEATFGRKPTSVSAESPADTTYGGMFTAAQGDWVVEPSIIGGVNGFLNRDNFHTANGRRLYRVQGYGNGLSFAAIWVGVERPPSAIITTSGSTSCGGPSGASITLDARTSIFDAAFPLGYEWTGPFGVRTGALQTVTLPIGANFVSLRAWDGRTLESLTSAEIDITQDVTGPTLTPPSSRTITTCTNANIGTATAVDACGGAVTITNNKPTKFPLGNTTVTWTARDQRGNTTTRTQIVTAVLGDSTSCCPANTTIIQGDNNNNTLTGTSASECILGFGGVDTINGNGGNDFISGGSSNDAINGGTGTDSCFGGSGTDTFTSCESQTQ